MFIAAINQDTQVPQVVLLSTTLLDGVLLLNGLSVETKMYCLQYCYDNMISVGFKTMYLFCDSLAIYVSGIQLEAKYVTVIERST